MESLSEPVEIIVFARHSVEVYYRIVFGNYKFEVHRVFSRYVSQRLRQIGKTHRIAKFVIQHPRALPTSKRREKKSPLSQSSKCGIFFRIFSEFFEFPNFFLSQDFFLYQNFFKSQKFFLSLIFFLNLWNFPFIFEYIFLRISFLISEFLFISGFLLYQNFLNFRISHLRIFLNARIYLIFFLSLLIFSFILEYIYFRIF